MNDELIGVEEMMAADGFIDFYGVLDLPRTAASEEILENINALYQDAQTNRDHRIPARRREYSLLLEILPQARTILTDKARRKRYDAYCNAVQMQLPRMPYTDFFNDLMREKDVVDTRSDILTVRDLSRLRTTMPEAAGNGNGAMPKPQPQAAAVAVASPKPAPAPVAAPVVAPPIEEAVNAPVAAPTPKPLVSNTPAVERLFPYQALVGGAIVLLGMIGTLPPLAGVPVVMAAPLALICGGVTAYVFSMTAEPLEA